MGIRPGTLAPLRQGWQGRSIRYAPFIIGGLILILMPPFLPTFSQSMMTKGLIFAIFAISLDILVGYVGLLSFGHAAFFGAGGYVVGVLSLHYGIDSFWITFPGAILAALLVAAAFGAIVVRFSGLYFVLLTFAFGNLLFSVGWKWRYLQSLGIEGIIGIHRPDLGIPGFDWNSINFYFFVFVIFVICFFLLYRFINSPFGSVLKGIHSNEPRMRSLGYNTWLYKYIAYMVAGSFAGVSGALYAYHTRFVAAEFIGTEFSFIVVLMVLLGGSGRFVGPIIGAIVIIFVETFVSIAIPERWPLLLGVIFVAVIMFLRGGIAPTLVRLWDKGINRIWKL